MPGAAHPLAMVKLACIPAQCLAVTTTLYAFFGPAGSGAQVAALVVTGVLAFMSRGLAITRVMRRFINRTCRLSAFDNSGFGQSLHAFA